MAAIFRGAQQGHGTRLGHDGIDRPGGGKGLAPARRPPGDGDDVQPRRPQRRHGLQGVGGDGAVGGEGVVHVGEHAHRAGAGVKGPVGQVEHRTRFGVALQCFRFAA